MEMIKMSFKNYYDIDMELLAYGPKAYMIKKSMLKDIIENELCLSYDEIINYCNSVSGKNKEDKENSEMKKMDKLAVLYNDDLVDIITTDEKVTDDSREKIIICYLNSCIKIYKDRINKFDKLIEAVETSDLDESKELLNKYDVMTSSEGVFYKDLERIIEAFIHNVVELYILDKYIDRLILYKINNEKYGFNYPSGEIQVRSILDKNDLGLMPLTDNQERKLYSDYTSKHLSFVKKIK